MRVRLTNLALVLSGIFVAPAGAFAADQAGASAANSTVEVVTVTATRRAEALKDVPISVTSLSSEQMDAISVRDIRDLNVLVPGLNMQVYALFAQPVIRGVGTSISSAESNVALYIDGVYQGAQLGNILSLANVKQIQVLKGPQGTLFGRNTTGGAILITTSDPSFTPEAHFTGSYGTFKDVKATGYVSGPIIDDWLAGSLSINYQSNKGDVKNTFLNVDVGGVNEKGARAKLLLTPRSDLELKLTGNSVDRTDTQGLVFHPLLGNLNFAGTPGVNIPLDPGEVSTNTLPFGDTHDRSGSLQATYTPSFGTIDAIISTRTVKHHAGYDLDYSTLPVSIVVSDKKNLTTTQEVNFTSPSGNQFSFVSGIFFYQDTGLTDFHLLVGPGQVRVPITDSRIRTDAWAVYSEVNWDVTERLRVVAGLRYSDEDKELTLKNPLRSGRESWQSWTPRGSVRFALTDEANIYATVGRGFKAGEFNTAVGIAPIASEEMTSYEVGYKFASPSLQFNVATYYYDFTAQQVQTFDPVSGAVVLSTSPATIYGIDADASLQVGEHWHVNGGLAWTHGRYGNYPNVQAFTPIPCAANPNGCGNSMSLINADGKELMRSPELTATLGLNYKQPLEVGGSIEANLNVAYNSGFYWIPSNRIQQPAYALIDGRVSWTAPSERYSLSVWGRNLGDETYQIFGNEATSGDVVVYGRPRMIGVSVDLKY